MFTVTVVLAGGLGDGAGAGVGAAGDPPPAQLHNPRAPARATLAPVKNEERITWGPLLINPSDRPGEQVEYQPHLVDVQRDACGCITAAVRGYGDRSGGRDVRDGLRHQSQERADRRGEMRLRRVFFL